MTSGKSDWFNKKCTINPKYKVLHLELLNTKKSTLTIYYVNKLFIKLLNVKAWLSDICEPLAAVMPDGATQKG